MACGGIGHEVWCWARSMEHVVWDVEICEVGYVWIFGYGVWGGARDEAWGARMGCGVGHGMGCGVGCMWIVGFGYGAWGVDMGGGAWGVVWSGDWTIRIF